MVFPTRHAYLTIHWLTAGADPERGQCGIRFYDATPQTQADVDNCAAAVSAFWSNATSVISQFHRLEFIRLASIDVDGKYFPGSVAYDHVYPGTIPGGGSAVALFPLQVAEVITLRTAMPRGRGHAGRCYLPAVQVNMATSWLWPAANVNTRTANFATMLTALNAFFAGPASVMSSLGAGVANTITSVNADLRPDTQRRRARQLPTALGTPAAV